MAKIKVPVGVHSAIFCGDYSSSAKLTRIWPLRTDGLELTDDNPGEYLPGLNTYEQSDVRRVSLTATFMADTGTVYKLSRKLALTADGNDPSIPRNKYIVFIASKDLESHILEECSVVSAMRVPYGKKDATKIRITFEGTHRNPDYNLLNSGSLTLMASSLGSRNPLI